MAVRAGTERVISDKMNWLAEHGHRVSLVTYEQGNHPLAFSLHPDIMVNDLDTRFFTLSVLPFYRRIFEFYIMRNLFAKRLQRIVDETNPDVIVTTTYSLKLATDIVRLSTKACNVMESHTACFSVGKEQDFQDKPVIKFFAKLFDKWYFRSVSSFDLLIVLTDGDGKDWSRYTDNIKVIPNPVTYYPEEIDPKKIYHRIICVARLTYQKGLDMLVDAFAKIGGKYPEWHVDIYGDGEDKEKLFAQINRLGLDDKINILPPTNNIYQEYQNSDFYVLSSRYEGYPLVLNEAMSCGTPCVAFRCKYGPEDAIVDKESGLLVKDGDVDELSKKMEWMIVHGQERLEMGKKARLSAARYKKDVVMQAWEQAYLSVMKTNSNH